MSVTINTVSAESYTTQSKLLLCQLLYDLSPSKKKFTCSRILDSFKRHPLIHDEEMKLNEDELYELVNDIMLENKLVKTREELPDTLEGYRKRIDLVTAACNKYFFQRQKEIEDEIAENKDVFTREYGKMSKKDSNVDI